MSTSSDALRGHNLIPSVSVLLSWPDIYSTESIPLWAKTIHAHFFLGSADWYIAELDHDDFRTAFGYVNLGDRDSAEWGYFSLSELDSIQVRHPAGFRLLVERDLLWVPKPFDQIEAQR